jgi:iron complex outermembrane receptor protein
LGGGSFGLRQGNGKVSYSSKQFYIGLTLQAIKATNDFKFRDEHGDLYQTEHAAQYSFSSMLTMAYRIDGRNVITASGWGQLSDREIPRATFEARSLKEQQDKSLRLRLQWERRGEKTFSYAKAAVLMDSFRYRDDAILLFNAVRTRHWYGEAGWERSIGQKGQFLVFTPVQLLQLWDNDKLKSQSRLALASALAYKLLKDRMVVAVNSRAEHFDGYTIVLPGGSASYQLLRELSIRINAQKTYRAPTLSELYFEPGGNNVLKPEQGWSIDGGYSWTKTSRSGLCMKHSLSLYNRQIKDWIIWLGGAIWTPHNLAAVHSRGIETENSVVGNYKAIQWKVGLTAAYTRATPTESYLAGDNSIDKQIPYVPALSATGYLWLGWKGLYIQVNSTYIGRRFITSDESSWLRPYAVGDLYVNYKHKISKGVSIGIQASINNIWNAQYTVVGFRPMPGINYLLGALLYFE